MNLVKTILITIGFTISYNSYAQLTEIKPPDTAQSKTAVSSRIYFDAIKENLLGHSKEAEVLFKRFVEEEPNIAAGYYELTRINLRNNNTFSASQNIQKAIKLDTSNKWYQEMYANILANTQKYEEAAHILSKMAAKYHPNEEYLLKSTLLYQKAKKYNEAIAEIEKLIQIRGIDEELILQENQIYAIQNEPDKIVKNFNRLIANNPNEIRYHALLAEFYIKKNELSKAKEILSNASKIAPDDLSLTLGLATLYKQQKDTAQYYHYINKAINNNTIDIDTKIALLFSFLQESEDTDTMALRNASKAVDGLLKNNSKNATLWAIYGDLQSILHNDSVSAIAYKKSLDLNPNNLNLWQQYLFKNLGKDHADTLLKYSAEAISMFPASGMLYFLNGIGYMNKENYDEAIKSMNIAIEYQSEDNTKLLSEMYANLAEAYHSIKSYTKADSCFEKAITFNAENASALNNYAYYLSERKVKLEQAKLLSEKSLKLRPGEATFLDTYGWILYQQGDYTNAKKHIEEAISLNKDNADATLYEHLGDIMFKLNDINNAVKYWQKALEKDPKSKILINKINTKKIDE